MTNALDLGILLCQGIMEQKGVGKGLGPIFESRYIINPLGGPSSSLSRSTIYRHCIEYNSNIVFSATIT